MNKNIAKKVFTFLCQLLIFTVGLYFIKQHDKPIFLAINPDSQTLLSNLYILLTALMGGLNVILIMSLLYDAKKEYFLPSSIALVIAGIIVYALKEYIAIARPVHHFRPEEMTLLGRNLRNYTFPSGHATSAMIFALYLRGNSSNKFVYFGIGILGGLSRILVGVHFPSDVWAGCWIGYAISKSSFYIFKNNLTLKKINNKPEWFYFSAIIGIISSIIYLFFHDARYTQIDIIMFPLVSIAGLFLLVKLLRKVIKRNQP